MNQYEIVVKGIKEGTHSFSFCIKDSFFKEMCNSEIKHANISAKVSLEKKHNVLQLFIKIRGKVNRLLCDVCAEEMSIEIENNTQVLIKESYMELDDTDEILYIKPTDHIVSIKQILFELIVLSIPQKKQHKIDEKGKKKCNIEMIQLIEKYSSPKEGRFDERWSTLKNLTNNINIK